MLVGLFNKMLYLRLVHISVYLFLFEIILDIDDLRLFAVGLIVC